MERKTIAQAVIEVLQTSQRPMTVLEITQSIIDNHLFTFNSKDPKGIVRGAIERRCEGLNRKDTLSPTYFKRSANGTYQLK